MSKVRQMPPSGRRNAPAHSIVSISRSKPPIQQNVKNSPKPKIVSGRNNNPLPKDVPKSVASTKKEEVSEEVTSTTATSSSGTTEESTEATTTTGSTSEETETDDEEDEDESTDDDFDDDEDTSACLEKSVVSTKDPVSKSQDKHKKKSLNPSLKQERAIMHNLHGGSSTSTKVLENIQAILDQDESGSNTKVASTTMTKRRRRKKRALTICLSHCRYDLVKSISKRYGLGDVAEDSAWNIYWTDYSVSLERAVEMKRYQIVNHFPGMNEICRKDLLARNLNRMRRIFPDDFNIFPMTWCLPADNAELQTYSSSRRGKTYICKPEMGCQGRGIFLVKNVKDVNPFGKIICQIYIQKPLLIDHLKFDLRVYVLLTSCDPLRLWVFDEGLARFATAKYRLPTLYNTENSYMHLTNYSVNKFSPDFVVDGDTGTKRKLSTVISWLTQKGYDVSNLQKQMDDVIIKTVLSAQPTLKHHYRTCFTHHDVCSACFEILGFDILLDHKLKPYIIEVNHSPSFHIDTKIDHEIKEALLTDTFAMLSFRHLDRGRIEREDRRRVQERINKKLNEVKVFMDAKREKGSKRGGKGDESGKGKDEAPKKSKRVQKTKEEYDQIQFDWEKAQCGRYRLIYPTEDSDKYDKFLSQNQLSLYQDTATSQARAALNKARIDETNIKKAAEEAKTMKSNSNSSVAASSLPSSNGSTDKLSASSKTSGGVDGKESKPEGSPKKVVIRNPKPLMAVKSALPCNPSNTANKSFTLCHIISKEECDRVRGLIQRGLLIRSLGIEVQAYQLLCQVGGLKKNEHDEFRRKHGFMPPNVTVGPGAGPSYSKIPPRGTGSELLTHPTAPAPTRPGTFVPPKFYMKLASQVPSSSSAGGGGQRVSTTTILPPSNKTNNALKNMSPRTKNTSPFLGGLGLAMNKSLLMSSSSAASSSPMVQNFANFANNNNNSNTRNSPYQTKLH